MTALYLSFWTSDTSMPNSLAASPGWGVIISLSEYDLFLSIYWSAPASTMTESK